MFERFSGSARQVIVAAQRAAIDAGASEIDSPDLLVALLTVQDEMTDRLLAGHELTAGELAEEFGRARRRGGLTDEEAAALSTLGVDVDSIIRNVEESLGEQAMVMPGRRRRLGGHIPFTVDARKTLEQCLREAIRRKHKQIGAEHLLLALLARKSIAADALVSRGITYDGVTSLIGSNRDVRR
ncbi:ATP-dependent Clp protease ATP-binding subunit ClpA [Kibdelosporangium banguiense]|uniref:ATP-dependent Clp protease ATP-binding subunit ClpA n=1 Tax=Kibdelosporangium banguiense TaxID=1365924 RepID=A0ABS4TCV1_9PSEU|nr:Clp protease N-terminal domain-containing protein [Kibdelosporangium banguiense]MBP2322261.1 ATP-dependent Clp protease ATP-binding subunit ClpA [Kibdelosporangium banguiense]